jgi:ribosomal protein RSM22 (predicted rRNA methylase)
MGLPRLPDDLSQKLEKLLEKNPSFYQKFYKDISTRYRGENKEEKSILSLEEAISYALARLPSTFQVFSYVLKELEKLTSYAPSSFLDVGCGPAASYWALKETYPDLKKIDLLEKNKFMNKVLSLLIAKPRGTSFILQDAKAYQPQSSYDIISFSYCLGEIKNFEKSLEKYWAHTNQSLIITEPGTPEGFQTILKARTFLLKLGAFFVAPCGHNAPCPLEKEKKDWCHFSQRFERENFHKIIKKGYLDYEDEKFSYLIATKDPFLVEGNRILKKPQKDKGYIKFDLCAPEGICKKTCSKSKNKDYKSLKRKKWGDIL